MNERRTDAEGADEFAARFPHADERAVRLDPDRQGIAIRRVRSAAQVARHHEHAARAERAKIAALVRTWRLCPTCYEPLPDDFESSGDAIVFDGACEKCYVSP